MFFMAAPLTDDAVVETRFLGVLTERLHWDEVQVALDLESEGARDRLQFREPHAADFRETEAEITEAEGDIRLVRVELAQEPRACAPRAEQLHDGLEVDLKFAAPATKAVEEPVPQQVFALFVGDQRHGASFKLTVGFGASEARVEA